LILAALLCLGAAANAAAPAAVAVDSPAACAASLSTLDGALPGVTPQVTFLAATCGSCSTSPCQNVPLHTGCYIGINRGFGTCQNVYGNFCSGIQSQCQCWNGPLP